MGTVQNPATLKIRKKPVSKKGLEVWMPRKASSNTTQRQKSPRLLINGPTV